MGKPANTMSRVPRQENSNGEKVRDYVGIATKYAQDAINIDGVHGHAFKLMAANFLRDVELSGKDWRFDAEAAARPCQFIEMLPHVEGKWDTPNITLHASHVFFLVNLFGFIKPDGNRRYTTALFCVARKNAKALSLATEIPTPSGWSTMGELSVGDFVLGADWKPCRVVRVSPIYLNHDCYELIFSNGQSVIADAGHLWKTNSYLEDGRSAVRTTKEIVDTLYFGEQEAVHSMHIPDPLSIPLEFAKRLSANNTSTKNHSSTVQIVDSRKVKSVPVKCIQVDSVDSQFLFGRTMLPTHNSTLAAGILLYCLCCEDEQGAQIITAATTGDQARIIFKTAKMMVERTPDLRETFGLAVWANAISRFEIGANLKPINAKASTQDGLNPSHVALDEIHAHPNHDLLNVLKSASGARKNPLFLYTTTEGYANAGPWQEIRDFADSLLDGTVIADHFLPVIFRIDEDDEPLNPKVWQKANPLMDVNPVLQAEIAKEAIEAANMSGRLSEFLIKRVNRPASGAHGYLDLAAWDQCKGEIDLDWLKKYPCYGGLDLSSTSDISSLRLLWRIEDTYYTWGMRWCPSQMAISNTGHGKEAYLDWVRQGRIKETPGNVIDHRVIRDDILALAKRFDIKQIAVDDSNARGLVIDLTEAGISMMPLYQGAKTYHGPLQELEIAYRKKNIVHDGDPVLRWMLSNVVVKCDTEGRNKPDKTSRRLKIDDASALLMAFERWITEPVVDSGSFIDAWYAEELAKEGL